MPTPSDERGGLSLQYAAWAFKEIGHALAEKRGYHVIVLTSTVLPGSTRYGLLPVLERASGKKCGRDFGLCYSPQLIALGSVIRDFLNPDFTLVGEFDARCGEVLESSYAKIIDTHPPCMRMTLENAELAKVALNGFLTLKITYANMLVDLCERIPGGDVDVVTRALGRDRRIGENYLKGALGYGGPCLPRDNVALGFVARSLGAAAPLAETTDRENRSLPDRIVERLRSLAVGGATVAILGLAYKPFSHAVEESQGIYLARALSRAGARVVGYDPLANESARAELHGQTVIASSVGECVAQADVVLVTTADPEFAALKAEDFPRRQVTIVDFWRILDPRIAETAHIKYLAVGRSGDDASNGARLAALWRMPEHA